MSWSSTQLTVHVFEQARLGPGITGLDVQAAQLGQGQLRQRRSGDVQLVLGADQHEVALSERANAGASKRVSSLSAMTMLARKDASPTSRSWKVTCTGMP